MLLKSSLAGVFVVHTVPVQRLARRSKTAARLQAHRPQRAHRPHLLPWLPSARATAPFSAPALLHIFNRMKPAAEERPTVEVTREDQDDINAYALLVQRRSEQVEALAVRWWFFFLPRLSCCVHFWVLCWACLILQVGRRWLRALRAATTASGLWFAVLTHTDTLFVFWWPGSSFLLCVSMPLLLLCWW